MSRVNVRYVGPHEAVEIIDGQVELTVAHGETVEVSETLAHGVPGDGESSGTSGLLDQPDNWQPVKTAAKKADQAGQEHQ